MNAADLVAEHIKLDDFCKAESKKFADHLAPHKRRNHLEQVTPYENLGCSFLAKGNNSMTIVYVLTIG